MIQIYEFVANNAIRRLYCFAAENWIRARCRSGEHGEISEKYSDAALTHPMFTDFGAFLHASFTKLALF
jgi:hypothetical protein